MVTPLIKLRVSLYPGHWGSAEKPWAASFPVGSDLGSPALVHAAQGTEGEASFLGSGLKGGGS